jgi:IS30 family transposase
VKRTELNLAERRTIEDLLHRKTNVTEIARRINRHRSTVYREIKRNFYKDEELPQLDGYYGMNAQRFTAERRARRRKLVRILALRDAVIDRLQEGWSPEQIAGRLKLEGHATTVSHETIYAYVYSPDGQSQALARHLPDRRKKRKPRYARTARGMMVPLERAIHNRPEHVKDRSTFGEWEGDLMIFHRKRGIFGRAKDSLCRPVPQQRPQLKALHSEADECDGTPAPNGPPIDHL